MKNFLYISLAIFTFLSCTPEVMVNKKLNGIWHLVSINGKNLDSNFLEQIEFKRDYEGGSFIETKTTNGIPLVTFGDYAVIKSGALTLSRHKVGGGYNDTGYDLTNISGNNLTLTQNTGGDTVYVYNR